VSGRVYYIIEGRRKKEEGRGKREEGRGRRKSPLFLCFSVSLFL